MSGFATERCEFLVECLDLPAATGVNDARWEPFQIAHLEDDSTFRIEAKSRQIAWSWTVAAEAVADALLSRRGSSFVSINQDEAKEKIRYARAVYENLQATGLPKLVRDNELGLEFDNGARLLSLPARPPRGKARMNVYLDEFAHVARDRHIYAAALPIISKGGRLRAGSSPMGASGQFWEIFTEQLRRYPGYRRQRTPWWEVQAFCRNVREARRLAPDMPTAERVELFGNERIKAIFANMVEDDFRQEYEGEFVDESVAWITWEEIKAAQEQGMGLTCVLAAGRGKELSRAQAAVTEAVQAVRAGQAEPVLLAGVDIGRTRNTTEVFLVGESTAGTYPLRLAITLDNVEFDDQLALMVLVLQSLPVKAMLIDQNGIGRNLAENLARLFPGKAQGMDFTNPSKALWATDAKMLVQQRKTPLPADRDIAYQIHSIKRQVTASKNMIFDTAANEKHHCYDATTEVLTAGGWKPIADITLADSVATLEGERLIFEHPSEVQAYPYDGAMVRVCNKQVDLLVTPNHRMYVQSYYSNKWRYAPASEILQRPTHRWRFKKDAVWVGDDGPTVAVGTPEQFAQLLGYYISEGCKASQNRIILYQNPGAIADEMVGLLHAMGKENVTVTQTDSGALRIECYWKAAHCALPAGTASEKRLPRAVLEWSPRLLRILLGALMDGDGTIGNHERGQWTYYTTSLGLANDITELLLRIGWGGTVVAQEQSLASWAISPMWRVNINRTRLTPVINKRRLSVWSESYVGTVHCVTTKSHLIYVRRNGHGVWCGNSDKFWAWALALAARLHPRPGGVGFVM